MVRSREAVLVTGLVAGVAVALLGAVEFRFSRAIRHELLPMAVLRRSEALMAKAA